MSPDPKISYCRYFLWIIMLLQIASLSPLRAEIPRTGRFRREVLDPKVKAAIEEIRASVPGAMDRENVTGLALALVDEKGIIWMEGFGHTADNNKTPVTLETLFPIGSLSRLINATAVMLAVKDGLVKLDEPITTYLPNFRMNSRYEEHPEQKITLRRLLDCTAGIPDTTPVGNILEPSSAASFEDHVKSLSGTWMACPVGSSFFSSSASFDLAAYVLAVASGKSYKDYMREKVFATLGMSNTTADPQIIVSSSQRAIGNMMGMSKLPVLGAGNVYSTARDLGRFIQLHINHGTLDGRRIIDESLMEIIQTPVGIINAGAKVYSGQGITIDKRYPGRTETVLWNSSWTFGFLSFLHWYPEYGIGMIVLTNKSPNAANSNLGLTLTDKLIKGNLIAKRFPKFESDYNNSIGGWQGWIKHQPTPYKKEWLKYCGTHNLSFSEYSLKWWLHMAILILGRDEFTPRIQIREKDGFLCVTESKLIGSYKLRSVEARLQEIKPGVFANKNGEALDFTGKFPTWYNFRIEQK
jgi:CubicO group peptidase (beta-lactamase class C family)